MASLIGTHNRSNGIKQLPCRAVLSLNGVGLGGDETHPDTITIVRDTRVFDDGEAPSDFNTFQPSASITWDMYGRYWFKERTEKGGNFRTAWDKNPANAYAITNEQGGNDPWAIQRTVDVDRAISWAAGADGVKCCILNLAGGTPGDFEVWKAICAPFIVEAWETWGHIYGRHCYADKFVNDDGSIVPGQPQRVIAELEYLRSIGYGGGMVLTECGLFGGYGVAEYSYFEQQVTRWEQALRPYADMFIGLCWWETGASEFNADYTDHLKQLLPYIQAGDLPRWTPPTQQPPDGGGGDMAVWKNAIRHHITKLDVSEVKIAQFIEQQVTGVDGKQYLYHKLVKISDAIELEPGVDIVTLVEFSPEDEPANPNPPPVVLTLPRGSKGVDLSNYQAGFFDLVDPDEFDFYIFRCSDGMYTSATSVNHDANGADKSLWAFADVGHASGKPWGIYHFLRPGNVEGQIDKVLGIYQQLLDRGTPPRMAFFDDGKPFAKIWVDVEDWLLSNDGVKSFADAIGSQTLTGIYTGKGVWDGITASKPNWWANLPSWIAAYGIPNNGTIPPWPDGPFVPNGFESVNIWQYSSEGQNVTDWNGGGLDMNIVGPYPPMANQPPDPPPPTGATYSTSFMKAVPNAWRVIRRFDGSGEDVYDLPLGGNRFVRVKNFAEGEWYNGNMRERDTSPAPQSDGTERLYLLNGGAGGQIAPDTAVVGLTYSFTNHVQFKAKQGCVDLGENSGTAVSTFLLKQVIDNYTFPTTGFTVDRLFWTVQTGENQLYCVKDGINIGWCGGGAQQQNNVWGGELAELYFDRSIPQQEPPKYC